MATKNQARSYQDYQGRGYDPVTARRLELRMGERELRVRARVDGHTLGLAYQNLLRDPAAGARIAAALDTTVEALGMTRCSQQ